MPKNASLRCLLDELKPLFGLEKIGTHHLRLGGRSCIMYRLLFSDQRVDNILCNEISEAFKESMKRLIAFRTLFSITETYNSSFYVRLKEGQPSYALSVHEPRMLIDQCVVYPSENYLHQWLDGEDIKAVIHTLLPYREGETLIQVLTRLQGKVEACIEKVDSQYIWMSSFLVSKISKLYS
jgi:hypothetical protein